MVKSIKMVRDRRKERSFWHCKGSCRFRKSLRLIKTFNKDSLTNVSMRIFWKMYKGKKIYKLVNKKKIYRKIVIKIPILDSSDEESSDYIEGRYVINIKNNTRIKKRDERFML